jgi:hypothetical protein
VASADQIYVDPSALRSLYLHDDRSARFCAWRRRTHGSLPVTRFGRAELVNSFHLPANSSTLSLTFDTLSSGVAGADLSIRNAL